MLVTSPRPNHLTNTLETLTLSDTNDPCSACAKVDTAHSHLGAIDTKGGGALLPRPCLYAYEVRY